MYVEYTLLAKDQVLGKHHERKGKAIEFLIGVIIDLHFFLSIAYIENIILSFHRAGSNWITNSESCCGFHNFMLLSDLQDVSKGFLVNDTLIIEGKITLVSDVQDLS